MDNLTPSPKEEFLELTNRIRESFRETKNMIKIKKTRFLYFSLCILFAVFFGALGGALSDYFLACHSCETCSVSQEQVSQDKTSEQQYVPQTTHEQKVINAVNQAFPSVVSIVVTKDLPVLEEYYFNPFQDFFWEGFEIPQYIEGETEEIEVGGGTGFIISEDGLILTNRHVVSDEDAEYTVLTNDEEKYPATVLAKDPLNDLAVIKIETGRKFTPLPLGDSDSLQEGQTVIAIGNALGEFKNTVSTGVISGLERDIIASGGGKTELLEDLIQTDAAINEGNSGGPLLNLAGEVIGVNVAMSEEAENIGFAIPINDAKRGIKQVEEKGEIAYPFLGIYYIIITPEIKENLDLPVGYGALIGMDEKGEETEGAVVSGSAAEEAGLKRGDIILEFDGSQVSRENPLSEILMDYNPGDIVVLKIMRDGKEETLPITLGKRED